MIASPPLVTPLTTALGAEVAGVDLTRPLDDATYALLRRTYVERGALFFRDQHVDHDQFTAFARRFGELTASKIATFIEGSNEVSAIWKDEGAEANLGNHWHTDQSTRAKPVMGTLLVARKVPASGGDTMFVSMAAAYDALSDGLKKTLRGLRAVHSNIGSASHQMHRSKLGIMDEGEEAMHPVVGRHPETGRSVLYVNPKYTVRFAGWTAAESAPLLRYLYAHAERPEFQLRFRWTVGTVGIWDNRQTWHYAVNDYPGGERVMHRLMVEGPFLQ
jgi:taurine dioxygenase